MIPGLGRFDSTGFTSGGFEIVVGVGTFAERRDVMLAAYREQNIALRGVHVIDPEQIVGVAELPEGGEMTPELREAVAKARKEAGFVLMPVGAKIEEVGVDLRKNEVYLDGIVDTPKWCDIGARLDANLTPMTVVVPRDLPCPSAEVAQRVNREFWRLFDDDPQQCIDLITAFASTYITSTSKALTFWPPQQQQQVPLKPRFEYTGMSGSTRAVSLQHHVFSETITPRELAERGLTLRNWLANTLCNSVVEAIDRLFAHAIRAEITVDFNPDVPDDLPRMAKVMLGGNAPEAWLMDHTAQTALGMVHGQVVANIPGSQAYCEISHPFPRGFILARSKTPGLHVDLPSGFEVAIIRHDDGALTFHLAYRHALDIDPTATGMVMFKIKGGE